MRHFVFWLVLACSASTSRAAIRDDAPIAGIDVAADSPHWFPHTSPIESAKPAPEVRDSEPASLPELGEIAQRATDALSLAWVVALETATGALFEVFRGGAIALCEPSGVIANL